LPAPLHFADDTPPTIIIAFNHPTQLNKTSLRAKGSTAAPFHPFCSQNSPLLPIKFFEFPALALSFLTKKKKRLAFAFYMSLSLSFRFGMGGAVC
jgi:hypothetical protein